jgi:hypothetical protein
MIHTFQRRVLVSVLGSLLMSAVLPAQAQNTDFLRSSDGKSAPATLLLKNLDAQWRRVAIDVENQEFNPYLGFGGGNGALFRDALAEIGIGVYFTKGQTVVMGQETYLIAYRIQRNTTQQEIQNVYRSMYGGARNRFTNDQPRKFPVDTKLALALLNMSTIKGMSEVRPFSLQNEIMGPADIIAASDANLSQLGNQLIQFNNRIRMYGVDQQQIRDENTLRQMMDRYIHTPQTLFVHPVTREPYRFNRTLLGKNLKRVGNASNLVAFYEAKLASDGKRGVVYLSGRTGRVPAAKWTTTIGAAVEGVPEASLRAVSRSNLAQIGVFLQRYARDMNGDLPSMRNASQSRGALIRYANYQRRGLFTEPLTGQFYQPNSALSGLTLAESANASQLVAFHEPKFGSDGKIGVVFLDGRVARVPQSQWKRVKATSVVMKTAAKTSAKA